MQFATLDQIPPWAERECDPLPVTAADVREHEEAVLAQIASHPDVKSARVLFRDDCSDILTVEVLGYTPRECAFDAHTRLCLTDDLVEVSPSKTCRVSTYDGSTSHDFDTLIESLQANNAEAAAEHYGCL